MEESERESSIGMKHFTVERIIESELIIAILNLQFSVVHI